jgi:small GTP-binding protein
MPANLPPQFFLLSEKLREAKTVEEKISILEKMIAVCPKHKGTEKVLKDLKSKIAKLKKTERKRGGKREILYSFKKEGAGQIIIAGPPNSGKTSLVNILTNSRFKVGDYPFTTAFPQVAAMPYEDIFFQLIDTPPLSKDFSPGWLKSLLKTADGILLIFEAKENLKEEVEEISEILKNWEIEEKKVIYVLNKIDLLKENIENEKNFLKISVKEKIGLENLKRKIFESLEIVRVYSKKPGKEPDFAHPFVFKKGTTLLKLVEEIHQELVANFKYARLFKKGLKEGRVVGKDYLLEDGDIIEIH